MIVARGCHGAEVHCRYCTGALHHWSRGKPAPLSASLQVRLQLESTLIECLRGQPRIRFGLAPLMRGLRLSGGRFTGNADPTRLPRRVVATLTWSPLGLGVAHQYRI
jgi:hypothetical protein